MPTDPKVVYIAGFGRSGSTLLGNVLGSIDGWTSVGELHMLPVALIRGSGCGCREQVAGCEVWSAVLDLLRTDHRWPTDPNELRRWQVAEARVVHTPRLRRFAGTPTGRPDVDRYASAVRALVGAIATVTEARVIVDASKTPADAAVLRLAGVPTSVVHLVRDPRAVAYSQRRARPTLDPHRHEQMHQRGWIASSVRWIAVNRLAEQVARDARPRSVTVRYEDFVAHPAAAIGAIAAAAGEPGATPRFVGDHEIDIAPAHTVWGNRSRFVSGETTIERDDGWRSARGSGIVTAVTAPWLGRYGYRWSSRNRDDV
jgi:hypothetical protein